MFRSLILLFLCTPLLVSAQQQLYLKNLSSQEILIQQRTILEKGAFPYQIKPGNEEYFTIPILTNGATILNVTAIPAEGPYGTADGIYYMFKPGDTLNITVDSNGKPSFTHTRDTVRSRELSFIRQYMNAIGGVLPYQLYGPNKYPELTKRMRNGSGKERGRILDSLMRPYIDNVITYCETHAFDPELGKMYKYFFVGQLIGDKTLASYKVTPKIEAELRAFYKDSIPDWMAILNCENCQNIPPYNNALKKVYEVRFDKAKGSGFLDSIAAASSGTNRNFLMANYVEASMETNNAPDKLLEKYDLLNPDPVYSKVVHNNYEVHRKTVTKSATELGTLLRMDKTKLGFNEMIASHKGRVVYVDFWASWCKPCLAEMPYSDSLRDKLKGQNVSMVYISVDADFNSWLDAGKRHKITGNNSFILTNAEASKLAKQISLGPIPRYLIIDHTGKIVRLEALRPSDPLIYETLVNLAEKKG